MKKRQKLKLDLNKKYDLIFNFYNVKLDLYIDPTVFSNEDIENITNIVKTLAAEISIDKTYVLSKDSKYVKTFMYEDGWNELCNIMVETNFGKNLNKFENLILYDIYDQMVSSYILMCLDLEFNYDTTYINIKLQPKTKLDVECEIDTYNEWKRYPGKWQTWKNDKL